MIEKKSLGRSSTSYERLVRSAGGNRHDGQVQAETEAASTPTHEAREVEAFGAVYESSLGKHEQ